MSQPQWLFTDEYWKFITNNGDWEWVSHSLWDAGITCPDEAKGDFYCSRFVYSDSDCPHCDSFEYYQLGNDWMGPKKCKKCHKHYSIACGTYIHGTKLPFYIWRRFAYLTGKLRIDNSSFIARDLGITQKSAWYMIDALRKAIVSLLCREPDFNKFRHSAEVMTLLTQIKRRGSFFEREATDFDCWVGDFPAFIEAPRIDPSTYIYQSHYPDFKHLKKDGELPTHFEKLDPLIEKPEVNPRTGTTWPF